MAGRERENGISANCEEEHKAFTSLLNTSGLDDEQWRMVFALAGAKKGLRGVPDIGPVIALRLVQEYWHAKDPKAIFKAAKEGRVRAKITDVDAKRVEHLKDGEKYVIECLRTYKDYEHHWNEEDGCHELRGPGGHHVLRLNMRHIGPSGLSASALSSLPGRAPVVSSALPTGWASAVEATSGCEYYWLIDSPRTTTTWEKDKLYSDWLGEGGHNLISALPQVRLDLS
ncbi:unnamed protein product [Polarella glacialis]|uniref:WW domain-containing protein n=1 Tax=Polarella glacialis TaxID=89957 RepID=A0A813LYS4_POLGL|nr:unnamed protein product [Polarella glacialis]